MLFSSEPSHQYRYLEPYKNRVFQSNTPDSNLYLAEYANNILSVVGKDVILEGLQLRLQYTQAVGQTPDKLVINITPGSVVHNQTMVEMPLITTIELNDIPSIITDPSTEGILIYTSYLYIRTLDNNPFLIEAVPFNFSSHTLTDSEALWNDQKNRIILGLIKFTTSTENNVTTIIGARVEDLTNLWVVSNPSNLNLIAAVTDQYTWSVTDNLRTVDHHTEVPPYVGYLQNGSAPTTKQYVYKTVSTSFGSDYIFRAKFGRNYGNSPVILNCYAIDGIVDPSLTDPLFMYNKIAYIELPSTYIDESLNTIFYQGELTFTAKTDTTTILIELPEVTGSQYIALSNPILYKSYIYRKHTDITSNYMSIDGGEL